MTRMNGCCGNKRREWVMSCWTSKQRRPDLRQVVKSNFPRTLVIFLILSHISHPLISHSHISHTDLRQVVKSNFPRTLVIFLTLVLSHISHPLISHPNPRQATFHVLLSPFFLSHIIPRSVQEKLWLQLARTQEASKKLWQGPLMLILSSN